MSKLDRICLSLIVAAMRSDDSRAYLRRVACRDARPLYRAAAKALLACDDAIDGGDWDESQHPRAEAGKFGPKGETTAAEGENEPTSQKRDYVKNPIVPADNAYKANHSMPKPNPTGTNTFVAGWDEENLRYHWDEHEEDYSELSGMEAYARKALALLQKPVGRDRGTGKKIQGFLREDWCVIRFDGKNIAIGNPHTGVLTMFPCSQRYFDDERNNREEINDSLTGDSLMAWTLYRDAVPNEEGLYACDCCGAYVFKVKQDYQYCPKCGWFNDEWNLYYPDDVSGAQGELSLNMAKARFAQGLPLRERRNRAKAEGTSEQ